MFVDEITIHAKAGSGGDGVVRWRQDKFEPQGGPAGGNGGRGGDVYMRAVRDVGLLAKYTGAKEFVAENGEEGQKQNRHGKAGEDLYIDVPVGATVIDDERERTYRFEHEGETHKILHGGRGGLGNLYFKSSTNRSPEKSTKGELGESGLFRIELSLVVDVGLLGFPNAGKSTLLNALTNTRSRVAAYPFTTMEPYLGDLYGFIIADIPGLIEGAGEGKGLGHKFLRHVARTNMLLHLVSLEHDDIRGAYQTIRRELQKFDPELLTKEEWVVLTKADLVSDAQVASAKAEFESLGTRVIVISAETGQGIKELSDMLVAHLRTKNTPKSG